MKLMTTSLVLLAIVGSGDAPSAEQVMIAGIGSRSCSYWTSTPTFKLEGQWALGFRSALDYVAAVTKTQIS